MDQHEQELATQFAAARGHLIRIAYAVLGSHAEAEDVVADCWMRLVEADRREAVRDVTGWGTVAVARAALDVLRSARRRREIYPGEWLPEPVLEPLATTPVEDRVTLDETVRYAVLVVLESLSPAERVSFVLHDLFGLEFTEIAELVGRTPAAARQLASRARAHIQTRAPRFEIGQREHDEVVESFVAASSGGDLAALVALLDPRVVLSVDGGGVVSAARRPVVGPDRVARFLLGTFARLTHQDEVRRVRVNGELGLALAKGGRVHTVLAVTCASRGIHRIDLVRAPGKLTTVRTEVGGRAATPARDASSP